MTQGTFKDIEKFEADLWEAADNLRANSKLTSSDYFMPVLGVIFLGKDYEVITVDDRLDKLADDFVEHCSTRWETGKSVLVCIDKITCNRMRQRIEPRWKAKVFQVKDQLRQLQAQVGTTTDPDEIERISKKITDLRGQAAWMESTIIEIIISEAQNGVRDFKKWDVDIIPHRVVMKKGFETPDGKRVAVDDAFKDRSIPSALR